MPRLLAGTLGVSVTAAPRALHEVLGQWVDWTRAVSLSRVLDAPAKVEAGIPAWRKDELREVCARARQQLYVMALDEPTWQALVDAWAIQVDTEAAVAPLLQHWQAVQRKLLAITGQLRGQLRDLLAQGDAYSVRLAEMDAVMEAVLSPRELSFFSSVPELLRKRFAVLHAEAADAAAHWLGFQSELRSLVQAELDARFLPIDGLLAALQSR